MAAAASGTQSDNWSRTAVCRLLSITERRLRSWERQGFIPPAKSYGFSDLIALRALAGLAKADVPVAAIRATLAALREKLAEIADPLSELKLYSEGRHVRVQFAGGKMEPLSGQLLLDFDRSELQNLHSLTEKKAGARRAEAEARQRAEAEHWFEQGLSLEQSGAAKERIIEAYSKAVELDPSSAGALVNLGTVYFNARMMKQAERAYTQALEADPNYALAHYNLGNLADERGDRAAALGHYLSALRIQPGYADAHYNLALLYQNTGQPLKAVHHWKLYLKADPGSSWSAIARRELARLRQETVVGGTSRQNPAIPRS